MVVKEDTLSFIGVPNTWLIFYPRLNWKLRLPMHYSSAR